MSSNENTRPQPSGETRALLERIAAVRARKDFTPQQANAGLLTVLDDCAAALSTTPARAEAQDEGAAGVASAYRVRMISNDPAEWVLMHPEKALDFLSRKGWESQPLYAHPSPTPAADADRVREVSWVPDASNPNDRRLYVDGSQWAKVYGWDKSSLDARCAIIEAALKSTAAKDGEE